MRYLLLPFTLPFPFSLTTISGEWHVTHAIGEEFWTCWRSGDEGSSETGSSSSSSSSSILTSTGPNSERSQQRRQLAAVDDPLSPKARSPTSLPLVLVVDRHRADASADDDRDAAAPGTRAHGSTLGSSSSSVPAVNARSRRGGRELRARRTSGCRGSATACARCRWTSSARRPAPGRRSSRPPSAPTLTFLELESINIARYFLFLFSFFYVVNCS